MSEELLLVGEVVVDYSLSNEPKAKIRLGGIIHAARAAWALGVNYSVGYFAPNYLLESIDHYLKDLGCNNAFRLGEVIGCPNTVIIKECKEIGDQGYDFLLQDQKKIINNDASLQKLENYKFQKSLIIWGEFEVHPIMRSLNKDCLIYVDTASTAIDLNSIQDFNQKTIQSLFISTSNEIFKKGWTGSLQSFFNLQHFSNINNLVLKENRGGSRLIDAKKQIFHCPSFEREIVHSVGVGDVYDLVYTVFDKKKEERYLLNLSSLIASEYASTTYVNDFKSRVRSWINIKEGEITSLKGNILPWEERRNYQIYIAAPDFSVVDTEPIDELCKSLRYHNFLPFRPIQANGEITPEMPLKDRKKIVRSDLAHLEKAQLVIAILLYNDPGTICEVGYAYSNNIPVLLYDPYQLANNEMFKMMCKTISNDLEIIITKTFTHLAKVSA